MVSLACFAPVQWNVPENVLGIDLMHLTQTQVSVCQAHQENAPEFQAVAPLIALRASVVLRGIRKATPKHTVGIFWTDTQNYLPAARNLLLHAP